MIPGWSVWVLVKHPFRVMRRQCGYRKVRFEGPFKSTDAHVVCAIESADDATNVVGFCRGKREGEMRMFSGQSPQIGHQDELKRIV